MGLSIADYNWYEAMSRNTCAIALLRGDNATAVEEWLHERYGIDEEEEAILYSEYIAYVTCLLTQQVEQAQEAEVRGEAAKREAMHRRIWEMLPTMVILHLTEDPLERACLRSLPIGRPPREEVVPYRRALNEKEEERRYHEWSWWPHLLKGPTMTRLSVWHAVAQEHLQEVWNIHQRKVADQGEKIVLPPRPDQLAKHIQLLSKYPSH